MDSLFKHLPEVLIAQPTSREYGFCQLALMRGMAFVLRHVGALQGGFAYAPPLTFRPVEWKTGGFK